MSAPRSDIKVCEGFKIVAMTPAPSAAAADPQNLAAGVVLFEPDPGTLRALVAAIGPGVATIYLFVNALSDTALRAELEALPQVAIIDSPVNFGVGEALNLIVLQAALAGFGEVILFDQDSRPVPTVIASLVSVYRSLVAQGANPAVVAPRLVAPSGAAFKAPRYFPHPGRRGGAQAQPVRFVPTSGSLVSIAAFRSVGTFRGDYFIDGIDLEWCFRAWRRGYSCWCANDVTMVHTVGEGVLEARALGVRTPRQRDFRFETYVRNTVYGFRLAHIPLSWKLRQAAYLLLQFAAAAVASRFRGSLLKRFARGFVNGLRGRLGPPDGALYT
jgi:rhamnosyltransferase